MAEYKTMTLYIGTAELAESFKEKASATVFGTPSAMVQAIAKGEAVVEAAMSDEQFSALIQLMMVSDPFPLGDEAHDVLSGFANNEARKRGCHDWVDAYHTPFWNRDMVDGK